MNTLDTLLKSPECEVVEFKEAKVNYDFDKLGHYFSAICNEAKLKGKHYGYLVFGVNDKREVVGSNYRINGGLDSLIREVADKTTGRTTFSDIREYVQNGKRVVVFEIPSAPHGMPIAFDGVWWGREGSSLNTLSLEELDRLRLKEDWSDHILPDVKPDDLDEKAIEMARRLFSEKNPSLAEDVTKWDDVTFLNKAKLAIKGKLTRTAVLLLGKPESEHFLAPADPTIRWVLKDASGVEVDYTLFTVPFLTAIDKILAKIRNLTYRYMKEGTLFPEEVQTYEPYSIREAINNCIAHQDYSMGGRINVVEGPSSLTFTNLGSFIPGSVQKVLLENAPEERYRNRFLVSAMHNLKMVDTIGSGISKMFRFQRERFFPLPDYDLRENRVKMVLAGKILDTNYARLLARNPELSLLKIMLLDKVQKGRSKELSAEEIHILREKHLVEGRKPNIYLSQPMAVITGEKAEYSRNKAFDQQYYLDFICKAIGEHKMMTRKDIDTLLWTKISDVLDEKQKKKKIDNLLSQLRCRGRIQNQGGCKKPEWVLCEFPVAPFKE
jgi:ATP-dependent DNA helicase RecG